MDNSEAAIVTFYSYKGGVGRSMALANVAWLLATKYGKKVLVVDWDLEAPGLHRFFKISNEMIRRGLLELLDEYKTLLREETAPLPKKLVDLDKYITPIPLPKARGAGSLSIIAAGEQDPTYAGRVNEFDWDEFYEKWHGYGFIEYLKEELKRKADIVLLDSRTGVTDIGGICTLQLPDVVVLLFALNEQNIAGAEFIVESILKKSPEVVRRKNPPILIIRPARVEKYLELEKKNDWEIIASRRLERYLLPEERKDSLKFMKENAIPYVGAYSFGETLAVEESPNEDLAKAFNGLATSVLDAASLREDSEMLNASYKKDRLFLLRRRITYFTLAWLQRYLWLLALIMMSMSLYLMFTSYQTRKSEGLLEKLQEQQHVLEVQIKAIEQQSLSRNELTSEQIKAVDMEIQKLSARIDDLYRLLAREPNVRRALQQSTTQQPSADDRRTF